MAMKRPWARWKSPARRYGLAVGSVAIALGMALASQHYRFRDGEAPPFDLAIALTAWYAGVGPSALAVVLCTAAFSYFFTPPLYSFEVSSEDAPYFLLFAVWALVIAWFVGVRRSIESDLRSTSERLQAEVEQRKHREEEIRKLNVQLARQAEDLRASNKD